MTRKIAIVHQSGIVRNGLASFIKQKANCEIFDFTEASELKSVRLKKTDFLMVFSDIKMFKEEHYLFLSAKVNQLKNIGITDSQNTSTDSSLFDYKISLFSSQSEINAIIDSCLKTVENHSDEHEGEELTIREKEVLKLVALGFSNKIIADKLFISIHTVISHRKNITEKLGIKSISGLTVYAILNNLLDTSEINPEDLI